MKRNIFKVLILSLILTVTSLTVILIMGRKYTFVFNTGNHTNSVLECDNNEIIEILSEEKNGNEYIVKVKSKKPGKVFLYLNNEDYSEMKLLYVHKSMIITDNTYLGKCSGCKIIPISLSILLIYIIYLLIIKYSNSKKENLYQYKNIAYLGIIIFLLFFAIVNIISIFGYKGLYETVNTIINFMSMITLFLFPLALITFIMVSISNINLIIKEGVSLRNLLGLFLGIFICLSTLIPNFVYGLLMKSQVINIYNLNGPGPYIYSFVESLIYLSIAYLECVLISTIIIAIKSVKRKDNYNKDYMIILGCQIRKDGSLTPLLKGRVDRAIEFRNNQLKETNKDLIFIPSGGKGNDEVISEGQAIKNYLVEKGISQKNIIVEDMSKNTYENIKFSNKLVKKKNAVIGFSTTNYHVLRTGLIASEQGLKLDGIGSSTKAYFWINAFIREFIGTLFNEKKKHIMVIILINIVIIIMELITYLANNL